MHTSYFEADITRAVRESTRERFERRARSEARTRLGAALTSFAEELEADLWDREGRDRSID